MEAAAVASAGAPDCEAAKGVRVKSPSRVRIPLSPPESLDMRGNALKKAFLCDSAKAIDAKTVHAAGARSYSIRGTVISDG